MSFRLAYDASDLHRAADLLEQAVEVARRVDDDAGRMAGQVADCGHRRLAGAAEDFLDAWGCGMKIIAEDATGLTAGLRQAVTTYGAIDRAGESALRQSG